MLNGIRKDRKANPKVKLVKEWVLFLGELVKASVEGVAEFWGKSEETKTVVVVQAPVVEEVIEEVAEEEPEAVEDDDTAAVFEEFAEEATEIIYEAMFEEESEEYLDDDGDGEYLEAVTDLSSALPRVAEDLEAADTADFEQITAEIPEEEPLPRFHRPITPFRRQARKSESREKIPASKIKDPYRTADYDHARRFGYEQTSREETVTEANAMDSTMRSRTVVFMKRDLRFHREKDEKPREERASGTVIREPKRLHRSEDEQIRENPRKVVRAALGIIIAAATAVVILFFWELLPSLPGGGYLLFGVIDETHDPLLYVGIPFLLLLLLVSLLSPIFRVGFDELLRLRTTPRSLMTLGVLLTLSTDLLSIVAVCIEPGVEIGMLHFPAVTAVLIYTVGHYALVRQKVNIFAVTGSTRSKYMLADDAMNDRLRTYLHRDERAQATTLRRLVAKNDVHGVSRRLGKENTYEVFPCLDRLLIPMLLCSLAVVPITLLAAGGESSMLCRLTMAARAFLATFFLLSPLAVTELRRLPIMLVSRALRRKNTALVGDAAAEEYARVGAIGMMSEQFLPKGSITLGECRGQDPETLRYYVLSMLNALGEPFSGAVEYWEKRKDLMDIDELYTENVRIVKISEQSVRGYVSRTEVTLFLNRRERSGYLLFDQGAPLNGDAYRISLGISVEGDPKGICSLYVSHDDEHIATVRAFYSHGLGIAPCHYTFLPFLNRTTLRLCGDARGEKGNTVYNLADDRSAEETEKIFHHTQSVDSGIMALNAPRDLWLPLVYASKIAAYNRFIAVLARISIASCLGLAILSAIGLLPIFTLTALIPLVTGVFGGAGLLFSKYYLS